MFSRSTAETSDRIGCLLEGSSRVEGVLSHLNGAQDAFFALAAEHRQHLVYKSRDG
jgi:hypothetical protein